MLICPLCDEPLTFEAASQPASARYVCPNRHSFDVARQGYINLLARPTRLLADTQEMLRARRAFLTRGHYAPLSDAVNELVAVGVSSALAVDPALPRAALDVGCGEGYYIGRLASFPADATGTPTHASPSTSGTSVPVPSVLRRLGAESGAPATKAESGAPTAHAESVESAWRCFGLDLARDAARMAASAYPQATFVVGNIRERLPFADASLEVLLNIFAPRSPAEFARVASPGAALVVVIPAAEHLREAREELGLLAIEEEKEAHVTAQLADTFTLAEARTLAYEMMLPPADLRDLVMMTPNARHSERRPIAALPDSMQVRAAFRLLRFTRRQQ